MLTIKIIAAGLLLLFYSSYFVKMLLLRRQHIEGDILGKGQKPGRQALLETVLKCVTYLGAAMQFLSVFWDGLFWGLPAFPVLRGIGLAFMSLGVILFLLAVTAMQNNWRAGYSEEQNTELVTAGIYKYSRNPAFLGFDLLYIGCALSFPGALTLAFTLAAALLFHLQIRREETFLASAFGGRYLEYQGVTMRYFGHKRG